MPRQKTRGVEAWTRLHAGQREHLEKVAIYLSAQSGKRVEWYDVIMDTLEDRWPMSEEPYLADKWRAIKKA